MVFYFGAHNSILDDLVKGAREVRLAGGNLIQIMLTYPDQRSLVKLDDKHLIDFKHYLDKHKMKAVIHSSYMHNIARDWNEHSWWLKNIEHEIRSAHIIGALGLVLHFGKQLELSIEEAYNNMYTSLIHINNKTKKYDNIKIFMETSSGQGTEMCYKLEDLAYFYKRISKSPNKQFSSRIKLCIDSCHVFVAGYNLKTVQNVDVFIETFEEMIGLRHVGLVHLNDSMVPMGTKKDRHQNIGDGFIGIIGLTRFFNIFRKLNVPIVLETPSQGFRTTIKLLLKT